MKSPALLVLGCLIYRVSGKQSSVVETTSGQLHGSNANGVMSFKGVRFAQAPIDQLRWKPPAPFVSTSAQNATVLSPGCIQQFAFATSDATQFLFNDPPPTSEDEDCLFSNVWAPSTNTKVKKPVLFYIYGGGFNFGTASVPMFDGTYLAANQDIVVVTINYRLPSLLTHFLDGISTGNVGPLVLDFEYERVTLSQCEALKFTLRQISQDTVKTNLKLQLRLDAQSTIDAGDINRAECIVFNIFRFPSLIFRWRNQFCHG
ncbi:Carboxylesterase family-domain-containing protein [Mycena crocata]|nr:Carboxylesterase family-domain-containing protein [Mycena crocata]